MPNPVLLACSVLAIHPCGYLLRQRRGFAGRGNPQGLLGDPLGFRRTRWREGQSWHAGRQNRHDRRNGTFLIGLAGRSLRRFRIRNGLCAPLRENHSDRKGKSSLPGTLVGHQNDENKIGLTAPEQLFRSAALRSPQPPPPALPAASKRLPPSQQHRRRNDHRQRTWKFKTRLSRSPGNSPRHPYEPYFTCPVTTHLAITRFHM